MSVIGAMYENAMTKVKLNEREASNVKVGDTSGLGSQIEMVWASGT